MNLIKVLVFSISLFSVRSANVIPFISDGQDADIAELPSVVSEPAFLGKFSHFISQLSMNSILTQSILSGFNSIINVTHKYGGTFK